MQRKTNIIGIDCLIEDLKKVYEETRNGDINLQEAKTIANIAGKLIKASSVKLEYDKFVECKDGIDFLKTKNLNVK